MDLNNPKNNLNNPRNPGWITVFPNISGQSQKPRLYYCNHENSSSIFKNPISGLVPKISVGSLYLQKFRVGPKKQGCITAIMKIPVRTVILVSKEYCFTAVLKMPVRHWKTRQFQKYRFDPKKSGCINAIPETTVRSGKIQREHCIPTIPGFVRSEQILLHHCNHKSTGLPLFVSKNSVRSQQS